MNETLSILESEIHESFIRSSGPGGQNVNKVSSAVQIHFNIITSKSFSPEIKDRLITSLKNQLTSAGEIVITSRESRSQDVNRKAGREKLLQILKKALIIPKKRRRTKPTKASKERRLQAKTKRSEHKLMRRKIRGDE